MARNSDTAIPTEQAVKTYVDGLVGAGTWIGLTDTDEANFTDDAGKFSQVNAGETGLEWSYLIEDASGNVALGNNGDVDLTLTFNANTSDGVIKWLEDEKYFNGSFNVYNVMAPPFNAVGDGSNDDTAEIQAAIDMAEAVGFGSETGGIVFFPQGKYLASATLTVQAANVYLVGIGARGSQIIRSSDYGNTVQFWTGATSILHKGGIKDMSFVSTTKMTNGAHIELRYTWSTYITDVELYNGWDGVAIYGQTSNVQLERLLLSAHSPYTTGDRAHAGIAFYEGAYNTGTASAMINDVDISGGERLWEYGVLIKSADGLWFTNVHIHRSRYNVVIDGSSSRKIAGIKFSNSWFDSDLPTVHGISSVFITGTTSGAGHGFGLIQFADCNFQGYSMGRGLYLNSNTNAREITVNGSTFYGYDKEAVYLLGGTYVSIDDNLILGSSQLGSGSYDSIVVATGARKFTISNNMIGSNFFGAAGNARYGIVVNSGADEYRIHNNFIRLTTNDAGISDSGGPNKVVSGNITDNVSDVFKVYGDALVGGDLTVTGDIDIDGNDLTSAGNLTITPGGGGVTIAGTLGVGEVTSTGALNGTKINTGPGDFEIGQDLLTTSVTTFNTITTTTAAQGLRSVSTTPGWWLDDTAGSYKGMIGYLYQDKYYLQSRNHGLGSAYLSLMNLELLTGNVSFTGTVSGSGGCCSDYVFEDEYDLMLLDDLQLYVKEKHQLPGMDVDKNKVNYSERMVKLLEKIEEQSLYVLQLHERIKALEQTLN